MDSFKGKWKKCNKCAIIINTIDSQAHHKMCLHETNLDTTCFSHGYISEGIFHAAIQKSEDNYHYSHLHNEMVLMNPMTMKIFNFIKGGYVLINNNENQIILRSWPCSKVQPSCVVIKAYNVFKSYMGKHLEILSFNKLIMPAKGIILSSKEYKEFINFKAFQNFVKNQLRQLCLRTGMIINLNYLESPCQFVIKEIYSHLNEASLSNSFSEKFDICLNFSQLELSNESSLTLHDVPHKDIENFEIDRKEFFCSTPKPNKIGSDKRSFSENRHQTPESTFYQVLSDTFLEIENIGQFERFHSTENFTFQDIGGLDKQIEEIQICISNFLTYNNDAFNLKNINEVHNLLIHGISGTGKSMIAHAIHNGFKCPVFIYSSFNESNEQLRFIIDKALQRSPSIIFLEDIHIYLAKKNNAEFLIECLMKINKSVLVIATTNKLEAVNSTLKKPKVFAQELYFGIPTQNERSQIFHKILTRRKWNFNDEEIFYLSNLAPGFTGGDFEQICNKVELQIMNNSIDSDKDKEIFYQTLMKNLKEEKPHAIREFKFEVPNVKWSDIAGMNLIKQTINEMILWPIKMLEQFKKFNITPYKGILLYGPPGCSKTMIAKAVCSHNEINFIHVKSSSLFHKYQGESEKSISELFKKAKNAAPCVLFFDEIDALVPSRGNLVELSSVAERVITELVTKIDGIDVMEGVYILAATNRPDIIDPSLMRPGRFDHVIYIPLPDSQTRKEIFELKLKKMPTAADIDITHLVEATEYFSGAEVVAVCDCAAMLAIQQNINSPDLLVSISHFREALNTIKPRTSKEQINFYENFHKKRKLNCTTL